MRSPLRALLTVTLLAASGSLGGSPVASLPPPADRPVVRTGAKPQPKVAPAYDRAPTSLDPASPALEDALAAVRRLRTRVSYDLEGERVESEIEGTGFIFNLDGARCVVSLAHVVGEDPQAAAVEHPRGEASWRLRGREIAARTLIDLEEGEVELALLYKDAAADLAFFRLPPGVRAVALPFPAGDSDRLRIGDLIYLLGRLEGTDLHVRSGIVSAARPSARVAKLPGARQAFMISAPLAHGDSGSPVLAVRGGRYELVGVAQGRYETARQAGWVLRINPVLAALRAALAGPLSDASSH